MSVILIVTRTQTGKVHAYIDEQVIALRNNSNTKFLYFVISGRGWFKYLKSYIKYRKALRTLKPVLIHAHYGFVAFFANLQRRIPVVSTYHGSDINNSRFIKVSKMAMKLSAWNIFVSESLVEKAAQKKKTSVIPCGIDLGKFYPIKDKLNCRKKLGLDSERRYILFSKAFYVKVKNYQLAYNAVEKIENTELIELYGYNRNEVLLLMNACDLGLLTSFSEGSPQFIKESMACNLPLVSTDVGDVKEVIGGTRNCFITTYDVKDVEEKINTVLDNPDRTNGRTNLKLLKIDNDSIAGRILKIYENFI